MRSLARIKMCVMWVGIICVFWLGSIPAMANEVPKVWFVKADAVGFNDGSNWQDAYADLQDALAVAEAGDEIWVSAGTYTPGEPGDRTVTFELKSGVAIYGGFAGFETDHLERDPARNVTVLNGDLLGNDLEVAESQDLQREATRADNSYHVVTGNKADETSILDGFVITGGNANGSGHSYGGGMINVSSTDGSLPADPTVVNCTLHGNLASRRGGGVYSSGGSPIFLNCTFRGNHVNGSAALPDGGGGMYNLNASPTVKDCTFRRNTTGGRGAGMINSGSSQTIIRCLFEENETFLSPSDDTRVGGGILNMSSNTLIRECVFTKNIAGNGGGVFSGVGTTTTIVHSLFFENHAVQPHSNYDQKGDGGALQNYGADLTVIHCTFAGNTAIKTAGAGMSTQRGGSSTVSNCIFWGNIASDRTDANGQIGGGSTVVTYSCVQGGWPGEGNIDANPLFAEPGHWADINDLNVVVEPDDPNAVWIDGDYHLKSEAGRWDPVIETWVLDAATSPCIDRGDPNSPVGEEPVPNGSIVNMGAYGGTPEASMSIGQLPPLPPLAHWKLDENESNVAHDSAGVNDAVVVGGAVWYPSGGQVDGALGFDGIDDYISADKVLNPKFSEFSVFAWIKGGSPGQVIISQKNSFGGVGATWLGIDPVNGCLMTELVSPPIGQFIAEPLESNHIITDDIWHHVSFVWDGSYRTLYVDGIEVAKDANPLISLNNSDGGLYIGTGKAMETGTFWSGLIDDVRIYNRAVGP